MSVGNVPNPVSSKIRWRTKALAHVEMMRPYTVFHAGLVAVAGAELASGGAIAGWRLALAALVVMCGWEAGLYAGDYFDRELDARSKPDRPVPSGRVSAREAFWTMVALIAIGYLAALVLGVANLVLAVLTTVLGIAYSKAFKNRALLGNLDRGVLGVCAVAFGALAAGRLLDLSVLLFALLIFCHDSATNLVGAIRDVEGDGAAGYRTVPVVYGMPRAVAIVCVLASAWFLLGSVLLGLVRPGPPALVLFGLATALALWVYVPLWRARGHVARPQALAAHKWLVAERLVLTSAFTAVYAPALAVALLAGALLASLTAQAVLRDRYEQQRIRQQPASGTGYA